MTDSLFIRLLHHEDKGAALAERIAALREGRGDGNVYAVAPESFRQVPNTPFCYWVSERIRRLFKELPPFEGEGRTVKQGLATADDFRFVRAWWEVPAERILDSGQWSVVSGQREGEKWTEERIREFQAWCRKRTYEGKRWVPFAKGGEYSPYYADIHLVVNWENEGAEIKQYIIQRYPYLQGKWEWVAKNTDYYFRPGLTWPRRTNSNFGIRALPAGCIFADKGPAAFVEARQLLVALGILFSRAYQTFFEINMAAGDETQSGTPSRSYEIGIVQKLPWPSVDSEVERRISNAVSKVLDVVRKGDAEDETTHLFSGSIKAVGATLEEQGAQQVREAENEQSRALEETARVDRVVAKLLGIDEAAREAVFGSDAGTLCGFPDRDLDENFDPAYTQSIHSTIREELIESGGDRWIAVKSFYISRRLEVLARVFRTNPQCIVRTAAERGLIPEGSVEERTRIVLFWCVGAVFGRWDVRIALDPSLAPKLPDPFDPLPVCPPGMLVGPDGLPAKPGGIVSEEWLRARSDANTLPPDGAVSKPTIPDSEYPLRINWDGILVEDSMQYAEGSRQPHKDDIVVRVREVLDLLWGDRAQEVEQEACEILGVRDLRDYFRKPSGFFQDHLKRYSKSRRKAPIYWPLSTASGSYTIWLYYHRLTDQTLYAAVNKYLEPKIADTERALDRLGEELAAASGREASRLRDRLNEGRAFLGELQDLREELLRVAGLPYKPDLNDGVIINAAPLHRLFRLRSWAKETEKVWKKLEKGDYDWAHMAYTIWPDRVREVCRRDRSIAIAHGLEDICEVEPSAPKKKGGRGRRRKEAAR